MYSKHVSNTADLPTVRNSAPAKADSGGSIRSMKFVPAIAVICLVLQTVGCVGSNMLDDQMGGYRNHVWANRAFNLRYGECDRQYPEHFKQGFVDGYSDICNGGDGYVPAVPPGDYWSNQYQSPEGAKCVNTWFRSYPLGVKAAREDGAGSFQKVYISKMIQSAVVQENADHVLPDDVPVVTPEKDMPIQQSSNPFAADPSFDAQNVQQRSAGFANNLNNN